jgi:pectinesterase
MAIPSDNLKTNYLQMKKNTIILLWVIFLIVNLTLSAQQPFPPIPRDTSYNVSRVYRQVKADFPYASPARDLLPSGVTEIRNVVYATLPDTPFGKRDLHMDVFRPEKPGNYPALVMVHGGGWRSGDKSMQVPMAQQIAAHGYVAACVEYRLSPEALYPAAVHDIKAAIRFLRANAAAYSINPGQIAISGCSAGGQLAALVGMTSGVAKLEGNEGSNGVSSGVQAIIDIDGVLDFTDPNESGKDDDPARPSAGAWWFGATFKQAPEKWIEASPVQYVGKASPPILFINSALPRFHAGRDSVIAILDQHQIYSEVHTIPGTPHPFWLFHPWFGQTVSYMVAFLDKQFK